MLTDSGCLNAYLSFNEPLNETRVFTKDLKFFLLIEKRIQIIFFFYEKLNELNIIKSLKKNI